jgi:DNA recombination protein RmuC
MEILLFIAGLIFGGAVAWFWAHGQTQLRISQAVAQEREAKNAALIRLEESVKNIEEQRALLDKAEEKFKATIESIGGEVFRNNSQSFLDLAKGNLDSILQSAKGEISEKTNEIKNSVSPLGEALKRYEEQLHALEKTRSEDQGSLKSEIQTLMNAHQLLQKETGNLVSALRTPHIRGKWGEATLKRIVEMAGMSEHCNYVEQSAAYSDEGQIKPDMILLLPGSRQLVIDSKFPDTTISDYMEAKDEAARKASLLKHSQSMRRHVNELSAKRYWDQFPQAPECVVMFVPLESSISAAFSQDPLLMQEALNNKVVIAGPVSFYALLLCQASGWRQEQVTKNTQIIAELGKQLHERMTTFLANLMKTRDSLEQSVKNFNKSIGSLESRVIPSMKKFRELGVAAEEMPELEPIEQTPRQIESLDSTKELDEPDFFSSKK